MDIQKGINQLLLASVGGAAGLKGILSYKYQQQLRDTDRIFDFQKDVVKSYNDRIGKSPRFQSLREVYLDESDKRQDYNTTNIIGLSKAIRSEKDSFDLYNENISEIVNKDPEELKHDLTMTQNRNARVTKSLKSMKDRADKSAIDLFESQVNQEIGFSNFINSTKDKINPAL